MAGKTRKEIGLDVIRAIGFPEQDPIKGTNPKFWSHTLETIFSDLWGRPGLTLREREMITIAVLVAIDADKGIEPHFRFGAPKLGFTKNEVFEIMLHAMYYGGWPRNEAFYRLDRAIEMTPGHPWAKEEWTPNPPTPETPEERRKQGRAILEKLGWAVNGPVQGIDQQFWDHTVQTVMCDLWARPGLSLRDRELITIAVLVAIDANQGIEPHFKYAAPKLGITRQEVFETILHAMYYSGWPKNEAFTRFNKAIEAVPDHPYKKQMPSAA